MSEMKEKLESAMADIGLNDDDDEGEVGIMDSDLEDDEDEVIITNFNIVFLILHFF